MDKDILTPDLVEMAIEHVVPNIEQFMFDQCKRADLAIVVTGTAAFFPARDVMNDRQVDASCITAEIRNSDSWEHPFDKIARSKAQISARTGRSTAEVRPHHRLEDDTVWWGSVVLDDIVVACSGVEPWFDEMFSMWIAATIRGWSCDKFEQLDKSKNFVGA